MKAKDWLDEAAKVLLNRTIVQVRYQCSKDAEELGWSRRGLVLELDNGTELNIQADDEGNDAGALAYCLKGKAWDVLPVLSLGFN